MNATAAEIAAGTAAEFEEAVAAEEPALLVAGVQAVRQAVAVAVAVAAEAVAAAVTQSVGHGRPSRRSKGNPRRTRRPVAFVWNGPSRPS